MSQRVNASLRAPRWLPVVWAAVVIALLASAFRSISWPFVDLYELLYRATSRPWGETMGDAFSRGVEYRPLLTILVKLAHQMVGLRLWAYQLLVVLQVAAILALLIWLFRPTSLRRALAACIAVSCVAGLHTSRVLFMFVPLNVHSMGVVLLLAAVAIAVGFEGGSEDLPRLARRSRVEWVLFPLTLLALLLLESGVLIVVAVAAIWLVKIVSRDSSEGAPRISRAGVALAVMALVAYAGIRFVFGSGAGPVATYAETAIGFSDVPADRLAVMFEHAPWLLWLYNVTATFLTVVASEPRAGRFALTESWLHGNTPLWMSFHVWTSLLTTAVIAGALVAGRPFAGRDRYLIAIGAALLIAGSALGFLYTRERIALSAGIGYGMLVFVAAATWLERPRAWRRPVGTALVCAIAVAWTIRTIEARFQLRDTAWENYLEWTERYESLVGTRTRTDLLVMIRERALARTPVDPRRDPAWTYALFERQYERIADQLPDDDR